MAERLTLYFDGDTAAWIDDSGGVSRGTLTDAARVFGDAEVVVLLPSEQIRLCHVTLPPIRQAARRLQAARYALEEQLAGRVEQLHFAAAPRSAAAGQTTVAVIDLDHLTEYVTAFGEAGLDVVQVIPDVMALPEPGSDTWQLAVFADRVVARTDTDAGFACDMSLWPIVAAASSPLPEHLALHAADTGQADQVVDVDWAETPERDDIAYEHDDAVLASLLNAPLPRTAVVNLLQGRFARQSQMQAWWRPLALTAGLAATWLVLAIASRAVELIQLNHQIDSLEQQSAAAFHDAFPRVNNVNDMRVQAEQGIQDLRGSGSRGGIFPLLQATAAVTGATDNLTLRSLVYRNGELDLSIDGENVKSVETLRAGFAQQRDTQLRVQSADANASGVQIRASLSGASS